MVAIPSPARSAAQAPRLDFARQFAEVKSGVTQAPTTALRSAYLDALAVYMIETVEKHMVRAVRYLLARAGDSR